MEKGTTDYKQIAFKLQDDIEQLKWGMANKDIPFLKEIRKHAVTAFDKRDIASKEMMFKMIDDWIDELTVNQK